MKPFVRSLLSTVVMLGVLTGVPSGVCVPAYAEDSDDEYERTLERRAKEREEEGRRQQDKNESASTSDKTESVKGGASAMGGKMTGGASAMGGKMTGGASAMGGKMKDGASAMGGKMKDGASAMGGKMKDGLSSAGKHVGNLKDKVAAGMWYKPIVSAIKKGGEKVKEGTEAIKRRVSTQ